MDIKKMGLYAALVVILMILWNFWTREHMNPVVQPQATTLSQPATDSQLPPQGVSSATSATGTSPAAASAPPSATPAPVSSVAGLSAAPANRLIHVKTDLLDVVIDRQGGNMVGTKLVTYPLSQDQRNTPVHLLSGNPADWYVTRTGLIPGGAKAWPEPIMFTAAQTHYVLADGQKQLQVVLSGTDKNGLAVTKTFTFKRDRFAVGLAVKVKNTAAAAWKGSFFAQTTRRVIPAGKNAFTYHTYIGAAISSKDKPYEKIKYSAMDEKDLSRNIVGGWLAFQQRYFLTAWVPVQTTANQQAQMNHYYSMTKISGEKKEINNVYTLGYTAPQMKIKPGATAAQTATFYAGPELAPRLSVLAPHLDLTVDYGFLWFLSKPIFWVMAKIHSVLGNWGWAIIAVTLLIKLLFYKLSEKSMLSMAKMKDIAPQMKALKERFKGDKQKIGAATMELYKKEKVNPASGCLPMIVQIPVFFALYYVLIEAVQLRMAPWILWIHDLSVKDPYYILPILMGASMFLQQKMSPPAADPMQAKVMMFLPVIFTFFFLNFPAGLVLYWLFNNCAQVGQQWFIMRKHEANKKDAVQKR